MSGNKQNTKTMTCANKTQKRGVRPAAVMTPVYTLAIRTQLNIRTLEKTHLHVRKNELRRNEAVVLVNKHAFALVAHDARLLGGRVVFVHE